eukprot:c12563_g1_i1 orf=65-442(+)
MFCSHCISKSPKPQQSSYKSRFTEVHFRLLPYTTELFVYCKDQRSMILHAETCYPRKFIITRCNTRLASTKSANARSRGSSLNSLFFGFTCILKHTARTAVPTEERKPERNALKGNDPTMAMYTT